MKQASIQLDAFSLDQPIARGGMGEVWRATHTLTSTALAVKVMTRQSARDPAYREAFSREVWAVARLHHEGIVSVFDLGDVSAEVETATSGRLVEGSPYLVMELAAHGALNNFRLPRDHVELCRWLFMLLDALGHAHARGVIHRDLKPGNILVCEGAEGAEGAERLKITDFGLASALDEVELTQRVLRRSGTPEFMPPEQIFGRWREVGPWTDLYALGCLAFALSTGQAPFPRSAMDVEEIFRSHQTLSPPQLEHRFPMPEGFSSWVGRLLEKTPARRFQSAPEAKQALRAVLDAAFVPALLRRATTTTPLPSRQRVEEEDVVLSPGIGLGFFGLRAIPMTGRAEEKNRLWAALHDARDEKRARAVILKGMAGIGKTKLAWWLGHRSGEVQGTRTLYATHSPNLGPRDGVGAMIERSCCAVGLEGDALLLHAHRVLLHLWEASGDSLPAPDPLEARALVELIQPSAEKRPEALGLRRAERHAVVHHFLRRLCGAGPVILLLDDVQWGREAIVLARHLLDLEGEEALPLLVVLTARSDLIASFPKAREHLSALSEHARAEVIHLTPLSASSHRALISNTLGLSEALTLEVALRTKGHPLFAVLLIRDWVSRGLLISSSSGYILDPERVAEVRAEEDLHELWLHQLDAVTESEDDREALEVASVLGCAVVGEEWSRVCASIGIAPAESLITRMALEGLVWISGGGEGWQFVHPMLGDSLERLARQKQRWRTHHEACAVVLSQAADQTPDHLARIGRHYFEAGCYEEAMGCLLRAAEVWRQSRDLDGAYELLGTCDQALQRLQRPFGDPQWSRLSVLRARLHLRSGRLDDAERLLEFALACLGAPEHDALRAEASLVLGLVLFRRGHYARVEAIYREALETFEVVGPISGHITCLLGLADTMIALGRLGEARGFLVRALGLSEVGGTARERASVLCLLATVYSYQGHPNAGRPLLEEVLVLNIEWSDRFETAGTLNALGEIERAVGAYTEALARYSEAVALIDLTAPHGINAVIFRINQAFTLIELGEVDEAEALLRRAQERLQSFAARGLQCVVSAALLSCLALGARWAVFEPELARLESSCEQSALVMEDLARELSRAARAAHVEKKHAFAQRMTRIAVAQWESLQLGERGRELLEDLAR